MPARVISANRTPGQFSIFLNLLFTIPECLQMLNKMVFTSQTHLFTIILNVLFWQHVSTGY